MRGYEGYVITQLRNVVPRQGTETFLVCDNLRAFFFIEKCSSPTGDGNGICGMPDMILAILLRNVVPRQGTET